MTNVPFLRLVARLPYSDMQKVSERRKTRIRKLREGAWSKERQPTQADVVG